MKKTLSIFISLLFSVQLFAQSDKIDSLESVVKAHPNDTIGVQTLFSLCWALKNIDHEKAMNYGKHCLELSRKLDWQRGMGYAYHAMGSVCLSERKNQDALNYFKKGLFIREQLNDLFGQLASENSIGLAYKELAQNDLAIEHFEKSIKISEKRVAMNIANHADEKFISEAKMNLAVAYLNLGSCYGDMSNYNMAIENNFKAVKIVDELLVDAGRAKNEDRIVKFTSLKAKMYVNLGGIYKILTYYRKAISFFSSSIKLFEQLGQPLNAGVAIQNMGLAYTYLDLDSALYWQNKAAGILEKDTDPATYGNTIAAIGGIYHKMGQYEKANQYEFKALEIFEKCHFYRGAAGSYKFLGENYYELGQYKEVIKYSKMGFDLAVKTGAKEFESETSYRLYAAYEKLGDHTNALKYHKHHVAVRDSLSTTEKQKEALVRTMTFEYARKALADSLKVADEKMVTSLQLKQEKSTRYMLYGGLALVVLFSIVMVNRFKNSQRQKAIIEKQKFEVEEQKKMVEEKQKEIIDSIKYAKRIQQSLLPHDKFLNKHLQKK